MHELWQVIPEYPDFAVSNLGRVKRIVAIPPTGKVGGRGWPVAILKLSPCGHGYLKCQIGGRSGPTLLVHLLVAKAFVPNPQNLPTVNHDDGDKTNNLFTNLVWATHQEQTEHGFEHGLLVRNPHTGRFVQKAGN
jgi:hypothetical protein